MHMLVNLHTHRLTWQILNCINLFLPRSFALPPYHRPCRRSTSASGPLLPLHATPTCLQAICKIDYAHKLKQTSDDIKMLLLPQGLLVTGHIYIYTALKGEWQAGQEQVGAGAILAFASFAFLD